MAKLTVEVDIDLTNSIEAGDVIDGIIRVLNPLRDRCYEGDSKELEGQSGIVYLMHDTDPDSMAGHWEFTA